MTIAKYTRKIRDAANAARTEAVLEGEINQVLKECLAEFGVEFTPHVNETLRSIGLSQVNADRPDGVFGHIVYDYKKPRTLSSVGSLDRSKIQLERYLDEITGGHHANPQECSKWLGFIIDGIYLVYCRSNSQTWQWSRLLPISDSTLMFLIHAFRSLQRKPLTAELLSSSFGKQSSIATKTIRELCSLLSKPRHRTDMLFQEWRRLFEQVSIYNIDEIPSLKQWASEAGIATKNASHILFAMHTYYSLVVKILTSELLAASYHSEYSVCDEILATTGVQDLHDVMMRIESGEYYRRHRVTNFLEGDFFSWYMNENSDSLESALRSIAREFLRFEPASAILIPSAKQDLLKEFYSSLVDEQIRHDLGEYYTPNWLAQHLLDQAGYQGDTQTKILDPTCGSGTFLVESIARLRTACSNNGISSIETLDLVLDNVKGIDLNPLAVISARANYILSIYDLVFEHGRDIEVPVYLADSINLPIDQTDEDGNKYFEYHLDTEIEKFILELPQELVESQVMGQILLECEDSISQQQSTDRFIQRLKRNSNIDIEMSQSAIDRLRQFYSVIESLEDRNWDKIWCRIIKNNFSPRGFPPFDIIVGNPPWVRWSRLPKDYRNRVKDFCSYYGLVSGRGYTGGIESDVSTVISFSAADNWLKEGGKIAFLITWTVLKSKSARGFRIASIPGGSGLLIRHLEDMTSIQPFPDAENETGIYIAEKVGSSDKAKFNNVDCHIWVPERGKSRINPKSPLSRVYDSCKVIKGMACPVAEWGSPLYTGEASQFRKSSILRGSSNYIDLAHRGTVPDCARVYWVKVIQYSPETNRALIRTLTENELPGARIVDPVEGAWIEADLLHPLIRGRDLGRYCSQTADWHQIIPNLHYKDVETEDEFADRFPLTYSYLKNYEEILSGRSTYKRYQKNLPFYVIYCIGDYSFSPYKVVWMEQQQPSKFRASVISQHNKSIVPNSLIVPDHKLYFASMKSENEAHYLCGFLNSEPVRNWLGGFLLGKQIGTSIFEHTNVPMFDKTSSACKAIASISKKAHTDRLNTKDTKLLEHDSEDQLTELVTSLVG